MSGKKATFKPRSIPATAVAAAQEAAKTVRVGAADTAAAQEHVSIADLMASTGSNTIDVPLHRLRPNPYPPRTYYHPSAIAEMADSLAKHKQIMAARGYVDENGFVVVIAGETRRRAAPIAGLQTLRVEILPKPENPIEMYKLARAENIDRNAQTPLDDAFAWKKMLNEGMYPTAAALAKDLDVPEDYVSRTLSLCVLPHAVVTACAAYPNLMTSRMLTALREFYEQEGEEKTLALVNEVNEQSLGYREVTARRMAGGRDPAQRARAYREPISYSGAKGDLKTFEKGGRLELKLAGLSAEDSRKLCDALKELLK